MTKLRWGIYCFALVLSYVFCYFFLASVIASEGSAEYATVRLAFSAMYMFLFLTLVCVGVMELFVQKWPRKKERSKDPGAT